MLLQTIDPKLIKPNPWQPRTVIDPAAIAELSESILTQGLLQPPLARPVDGHYELAFGHRRLLAWQSACPGKPMPVQVEEIADRQMAEFAATENAARRDLNPIERAAAIKRLMDEFHMTQVEAGRLFGLASQGAVSNAVRLLKLPAATRALVSNGELAERHGRALLPLVRAGYAQVAEKIAAKLAQADEGERDEELDNELWQMHGKWKNLKMAPWPLTWPKQPIPVEKPVTKIGEPAELQACRGCDFILTRGDQMCLRPACHALKFRRWAKAEAERVGKKLGIAVAAPGEKVTLIAGHTWDHRGGDYKGLLTSAEARALMRIVPANNQEHAYERKAVLGSEVLLLATVNEAGLRKLLPKVAAGHPALSRMAKRVNKYEAEEKKAKADADECRRLCEAAAEHFAAVFPDNAALLELLMHRMSGASKTHNEDWESFKGADLAGKREFLALLALLSVVPHWQHDADAKPGKAAKKIGDLAQGLKVRLPAGWDTPPAKARKA